VIVAFMHNQTHLEQRLKRIQEVLNFDDADEDFLEEEQKRNEAIAEDQEETKGDAEPIVSKRNST
jgi:aminoglycoside phosphotransferase